MADLQRYFLQFNDNIRLDPYDENATLRDKRDILVKELKDNLPSDVPAFRVIHQGSYAMNTGTRPPDGNYDIDVGLVFSCKKDKYPDPVALKRIVARAIERSNRTVRIRKPCVTVEYMRDGQVEYHVDLAIYVERDDGIGLDLAVGRETCPVENRRWEQNDPEGLVKCIRERHKDEDARQMRHCIRYLKRWRDHRFPNCDGPISVALTVAAYHWFAPQKDIFTGKYNDAIALKNLVRAMLDRFVTVVRADGVPVKRLAVASPVVRYEDLMAGMTDAQMTTFHDKLEGLHDKLGEALDEELPEEACKILRKQFGDEFPVPAISETAKKVAAPYVHTGQSA